VALILLKVFGIPPVQWVGYLPLLREIHFAHYFGIPLGFALAFLGALGVDTVERGYAGSRRSLAIAMLTILGVASVWFVMRQFGMFASPNKWYWVRDWLFLCALALTAAIVLLATAVMRRPNWLAISGLLMLVTVEGFFNNVYPSPRAFDIFKNPPQYVRVLKEATARSRARVLTFALLNANLNSAFEIFSMDSLMPFNPPRIHELYERYADGPASIFMREARRIPPDPVLDRAGVGVVAIRGVFHELVQDAQNRGWVEKYGDDYARLFERPTLPRFFFTSQYRVLPSTEVLEAIATAPSRDVLLERELGFPATSDLSNDPAVIVESYRRNSIIVAVDAPRRGILYASDSYFDGWTALVNGSVVPILAANYAFRAVAVEAGRSRIEFKYRPPGLTTGMTVSSLSVLVVLGISVGSRSRSRPARL
jgi:hypothetical protein